jgi:hypothetical protein
MWAEWHFGAIGMLWHGRWMTMAYPHLEACSAIIAMIGFDSSSWCYMEVEARRAASWMCWRTLQI